MLYVYRHQTSQLQTLKSVTSNKTTKINTHPSQYRMDSLTLWYTTYLDTDIVNINKL